MKSARKVETKKNLIKNQQISKHFNPESCKISENHNPASRVDSDHSASVQMKNQIVEEYSASMRMTNQIVEEY